MLGKSSIKPLALQSPENKVYILKLIAHQKLGAKWIYFRKIKRADQGLAMFREKSLMEQMKATRSALRFTTKNARKLYRLVYLDSLKDIKTYTGLKSEFPELQESESSDDLMSLNSEHDSVIISWTPIKFILPIVQLRAKGGATQRHTEGLAAKLLFKVAGYYAAPSNWDRYKLNLYVRRITAASSYQEVVSELEPLKTDLEKFVEAYEPFKFGKASLSKDVAMDKDAFDDAMAIESFEAQLDNLYWYNFIYLAIEQFLFRYYLTLVISTVSTDAIRYLTTIFEPALQKAIENRSVFLGSFETDRTKRAFRVPYQRLVKEKVNDPLKKNIKTQMGNFETFTYNLPMLSQTTLTYDLDNIPDVDSEWGTIIKHFILNIDRPEVVEKHDGPTEVTATEQKDNEELKAERQKLNKEKEKVLLEKKDLTGRKSTIKQKANNFDALSKDEKIQLEEEKAKILAEELELDTKIQALKDKYKQFENKQKDAAVAETETQKRQEALFIDPEAIIQFENELSQLPIRQFVLMSIMTTMMNCVEFKRQARYKIMERFKERVENDKELETKRIDEIRKKAEKKLRELKKRMGKMDRLKQDESVKVMTNDINKFEKGIEQRIEIIKKDSEQQLEQQKNRLNKLFKEISNEKSISLGESPKLIWDAILQISPNDELSQGFPSFVSDHIQSNYTRELEPFYKNIFNIIDLQIKDKILIIQSLEKSNVENSIKLILDDGEEKKFQMKIDEMKAELVGQIPDLFACKIVFSNKLIPINDLFSLSIDNKSLNTLLILKVASPKKPQNFNLQPEVIKALLELNSLQNPLPKHNIMQSGKGKEQNPEKRINSAILNSLLAKVEKSNA